MRQGAQPKQLSHVHFASQVRVLDAHQNAHPTGGDGGGGGDGDGGGGDGEGGGGGGGGEGEGGGGGGEQMVPSL